MSVALSLALLAVLSDAQGPSVADLLRDAQAALKEGKTEEAMRLAGDAIKADPNSAHVHFARGVIYESLSKHKEAVADFDKAIALDPKGAAAYNHRGSEQLKLGHFTESIKDFDRYLQLKPEDEPGHWRRGIAYYYAGKFEEGRKQFEGFQTVDNNDVENAVWRYLCMARASGADRARQDMLKIGNDRRVPMMQIYALFRGRAKPNDVLSAAKEGNASAEQRQERLFYAHLYLGLYHDAAGDKQLALEHLTKAANDYKIGHYMWDIALVHRDLLRKELKR